jgi:hypothetical protein
LTVVSGVFASAVSTAATVSRMSSGDGRPDPLGEDVRDQLADGGVVVERGDDAAAGVALPGRLVDERVREDGRADEREVAAEAEGEGGDHVGEGGAGGGPGR